MGKRNLSPEDERSIALVYLCGVRPQYIEENWGVGNDVVKEIVSRQQGPLIDAYRERFPERRERNAAHLHLSFTGFDVKGKELFDDRKDMEAAAVVDIAIYKPLANRLVREVGLEAILEPTNGIEMFIQDALGDDLTPENIAEAAILENLNKAYGWNRDFSLDDIYTEARKSLITIVKSGELGITKEKAYFVNRFLTMLSDKEREIIKSRYGLETFYPVGPENIEAGEKEIEPEASQTNSIVEAALTKFRSSPLYRELKKSYFLTTNRETAPTQLLDALDGVYGALLKFDELGELENRGLTLGDFSELVISDSSESDLRERKKRERVETGVKRLLDAIKNSREEEQRSGSLYKDIPMNERDIEFLELSPKLQDFLRALGIDTVGKLVKTPQCELLRYKSFSPMSLDMIKIELEKHGIDFVQPEDPLEWSVRYLDIKPSVLNSLERRGVVSIGDMIRLSDQDLLEFENIGDAYVVDIKSQLSSIGLSLAQKTVEHPVQMEAFLKTPVNELMTRTSAQEKLAKLGIQTVDDVIKFSGRDLFIVGVTLIDLKRLRAKISKYGLKLND